MSSPVEGNSTDVSLLRRVQHGEAIAWQRFDTLYRRLIGYWCRRAGYRGADVEDICQEVFIAVNRAIASFRKESGQGTFRGWLFQITRRKIIDYYNAKKQRQEQPLVGEAPWLDLLTRLEAEEESADAPSRLLLLQRALDLVQGEFSANNWQAFWLTAVEGLTASEAAGLLGLKPTTVRQAKARVLHRLRQEFKELL